MTTSILNRIKMRQQVSTKSITVEEYLRLCKKDKAVYASPYERMLEAIGEPIILDTSKDPRMAKIFQNRKLRIYESFEGFYGMQDTIQDIVNYFRAAAQGLEEANQILYLLGPVGGGKTSLAERVKSLMENVTFYKIKDCPMNESPLNLFDYEHDGDLIEEKFGISRRYLKRPLCPDCVKRMELADGDPSIFEVVEDKPNKLMQIAISETEPADESTQDISTLVGKVDVRKLGKFEQSDPRCYSFSGGLNKANRGILDFREMFKAPIKTLNPLLFATQEGHYKGTEGFGAIPWDGIILAHSNESEWDQFRNEKKNEAFLDRVCMVRVKYALSTDEEKLIYEKLKRESALNDAPCAPMTLDVLSQFSVVSRLVEPENSSIFSKMKVYNGETLKDTDPKAMSIIDYRNHAGIDEGMSGVSTRFAFKVLSATFNRDAEEVAANPVHLMSVLKEHIIKEKLPEDQQEKYLNIIDEHLLPKYVKDLEKEIKTAYLESYSDFGQNLFNRYFHYADAWIEEEGYRDPDTDEMYDKKQLDEELVKLEKPAGIHNSKEFRSEVVMWINRFGKNNDGAMPKWTAYEKMKDVIEKRMFSSTEELIPIISFTKKQTEEDQKKHDGFKQRMIELGYTERQIKILCDWYLKAKKST